jgi:holo-[acyl-carrier protein] synthase
MRIIGHGVDLVRIDRIEEMVRDHAERFLERCFTVGELGYCLGRKRQGEHLAARFAAKEAVLKAMGKGLADGMTWTEVEVVRSASGVPEVVLSGRAAVVAREMGIARVLVSLSHTDDHAMASAIAVGE